MTNDSVWEFLERAVEWWENLDDDKKSQFIQELYARENHIRME
jgi:hypothetical protein